MARDEESWLRQVLLGLGALVVVSVLVGGVIGAMVLGATRMTGLGESSGEAAAPPSLYIPTDRPTTRPETFPDPTPRTRGPKASASASPSASRSPKKKASPISLQAVPKQAASGERINLSGSYRKGDGSTLQVQRFEDGWTDFPVTVSVSGEAFTTFIFTERAGKSRFRVLDKAAGKASNPVTVTIG